MLLILTSNQDFTADYLIVELLKLGLPYFRLNCEDLSKANYSFALNDDGILREITIGPRTLDLSKVQAIWYRRAIHPGTQPNLSHGESVFVAGEFRHLVMGLVWNPNVLWVNPIDRVSVAEHKLYQLQVARRQGLRVPRTIISQDVTKLRRFVTENESGTICKPIFHGLLIDDTSQYSVYTRRVDPEDLDAESVKICPVLLQEEIPRTADIRATFIGSKLFVADITGEASLVDWRDPEVLVKFSASHLTPKVEGMCRAMLHELGLVYGAFDFIRTPDDELVFLEINPTGEWAWLEDQLGFPMREAFIDLFFGERK